MIDSMFLSLLRRDPVVRTVVANVDTPPSMVFPASQYRYAIILSAQDTIVYNLAFDAGSNQPCSIRMYPASEPVILTEDMLGGLIKRQVNVNSVTTIGPWAFTSLEYQPHAWAVIERLYREFLSEYQPS